MERHRQRGSSFIETAIALAVVAIVAGAALNAAIATTHAAAVDPERAALQSAARREMTIARDVLKYRGASIAPAAAATTLPMPAGTPLAVELSIATSRTARGAIRVVVAAAASNRSGERAALEATLSARAPLPGAIVHAPGIVPAPTGAP
ncbi:MAG TPA: prepilin-type N-terminal cleavage/methylation domain-containing protein [Candidatus Tumulicola sp.]